MLNQKTLNTNFLKDIKKFTLIWTNPNGVASLTSTMGEEEVLCSSVSFDGFLVEFRAVYNEGSRVYQYDFIGALNMYAYVYSVKNSGNPINIYRRSFYPVVGSKMHFTDCTRISSNAANITGSDTGCLVPLRIWGIKF